jgi:hypothetical protein
MNVGHDNAQVDIELPQRVHTAHVELYRHLLDFARDSLYGLSAGGNYQRTRPAMRAAKLIEKLAALLDRYAVQGVAAALQKDDAPSYAELCEDFGQAADRNVFLARYPLLANVLPRVTSMYIRYIREVCDHVLADWNTLATVFFPGQQLVSLERIGLTGSDLHKGGKQVVILTFRTQAGSDVRLVHKPSDVEADYLLIGRSDRVRRGDGGYVASNNPDAAVPLAEMSLVERINHYMAHQYDVDGESNGWRWARGIWNSLSGVITMQLPTYVILPRNPGSRAVEGNDHSLPVRNSYGYLEFLTHVPECDEDKDPTGVDPRVLMPSDDWVTDYGQDGPDPVDNFHRQLGGCAALAMAFSITDLHVQNLIVHKLQPCLIDLEISFLENTNDALASGLFGGTPLPGARTLDYSSRHEVFDPTGDDVLDNEYTPTYGKNRLYRHRRGVLSVIGLSSCREQILWGFTEVAAILRRYSAQFIAHLQQATFRNAVARALPYNTGPLEQFHRRIYSQNLDVDPEDWYCEAFLEGIGALNDNATREAWDVDANEQQVDTDAHWPQEPKFAAGTYPDVIRDLLNGDIPIFYHRLGGNHAVNSFGETLNVKHSDQRIAAATPVFNTAQPMLSRALALCFVDADSVVVADENGFLSLEDDRSISESVSHSAVGQVSCMRSRGGLIVLGNGAGTLVVLDLLEIRHTIRNAHAGGVLSVCIAPGEGKYFCSSGNDSKVKVWNLDTGQLVWTYTSDDPVRSCALLPGARQVMIGRPSGEVQLWDFENKQRIQRYRAHHCWVSAVAVSADGATMLSGDVGGMVRRWQVEDAAVAELAGYPGAVRTFCFSGNLSLAETLMADGRRRVWNVDTLDYLFALRGNKGRSQAVAFSADGARIAAVDRSGIVKIWRVDASPELPDENPIPYFRRATIRVVEAQLQNLGGNWYNGNIAAVRDGLGGSLDDVRN